jgi:transcriptional regulator with XRE-family HTH domain
MADDSLTLPPRAQLAFGARLRALRKERRMTLRQLAAASGIHWTYVGQIERGMRNLSLLSIIRLAKALKIDGSDLLRGLPQDVEAETGG